LKTTGLGVEAGLELNSAVLRPLQYYQLLCLSQYKQLQATHSSAVLFLNKSVFRTNKLSE